MADCETSTLALFVARVSLVIEKTFTSLHITVHSHTLAFTLKKFNEIRGMSGR